MDDSEVIATFLEGRSPSIFGPSLHVERGTLMLDGWWALAHRVSDRTVIVRDEEAPGGSTAPDDVAAALMASGLLLVGADLPAIALLTYTNLDLGYAPWALWSCDLASGEADLNAKATEETFLEGGSVFGPEGDIDNTDNARAARRLAGAPSRVVLAVGVRDVWAAVLQDSLDDCRIERRAFGEIAPEASRSLLPTLVLVDATGPAGSAFLVELSVGHPVRTPVVAITTNADMHQGADATVDATHPPGSWVPLIEELLR